MSPLHIAGSLAERALTASPVAAWFNRKAESRFTVLAYHDVSDPEQFALQMDYVKAEFHPVSLDEVTQAVENGRPLPPRALLVTFDDGYRSVLEVGLPVLQARSIPAVVYVVAGLLGTDIPFWVTEVRDLVGAGATTAHVSVDASPDEAVRRLKRLPNSKRLQAIGELRETTPRSTPRESHLTFDELHDLERGGIAVGNHTLTHPCLHQCDTATVQRELVTSQAILAEALGKAPSSFAYPNGDQDPRVVRAVEEVGFTTAFLFNHAAGPNPPSEPLRIPRYRVDTTTPLARFVSIVSGLHPALHRLRGGA